MLFTIFIVAVLLYASYVERKDNLQVVFYKAYSPIFIALFLLFSLQYDVGTDYFSYLQAATNDGLGAFKLNQFVNSKEYLFAAITYVSQICGYPQLIFILSAVLQVGCLYVAVKQLHRNGYSTLVILFLYFTLCTSFFNQFNGIRQCIAANLVFLAALLQIEDKKSIGSWILVLLAPFFHKAAWLMVAMFVFVYLFQNRFRYSCKVFCFGTIICLVLCALDWNAIITFLLQKTGILTYYVGSDFVERMSLMQIATKVAKLFVVYYCAWQLSKVELTMYENKLMILSEMAVFLMLLSFASSLLWRTYWFLDLFVMLPVVIWAKYCEKKIIKGSIAVYLALMLLAKLILFPSAEYLYESILFR